MFVARDVKAVIDITPMSKVEVRLIGRTRKAVRDQIAGLGAKEVSFDGSLMKGLDLRSIAQIEEIIGREYPEFKVAINDRRPKARREGDRVRWNRMPNGYRIEQTVGWVGNVPMFSVSYKAGGGYSLSCKFPCACPSENRFDSQEDAQNYAESVIRKFLRQIGAEFKDL